MEAFPVLFVLGMIFFIAWGIIAAKKQQLKREEMLVQLGKVVNGKPFGNGISGSIGGTSVILRYTTRGSGKSKSYWTEIEAELPLKYPLTIYIRKHGWLDAGKIEAGDMVDVILGDPEFDAKFLVEAAPADIARVLLDGRARGYLLGLVQKHWFEITTVREGAPHLKLSMRSWIDDLTDAEAAVEAMTALAGRVRMAYAGVEKAAELRSDSGTPYRPMLDDSVARDEADERLNEVARVDKIQTDREARSKMIAVVVVIGVVFAWLLLLAAGK